MRRVIEIVGGIFLTLFSVGVIFFSTSAMHRLAMRMNPGEFIFTTGVAYVGGLVGVAVGIALITNEFRKAKRR